MTDKASDIIGFDDIPNINDCITPNTANDFITLPYPTIALELSNGLKEFVTPISSTDFKFFIFFKEAKISLFKFVYINSNHHQIQS